MLTRALLVTLGVICLQNFCNADVQYVAIRSVKSGLVLGVETENSTVILEGFTLSDLQLWQLQPSSTVGVFNIINKKTEKALDIDIDNYDPDIGVYLTFVNTATDSVNQQWFINSDASIASAGFANHVLDIYSSEFNPGTPIILYQPTQNANQQFSLEPQSTL